MNETIYGLAGIKATVLCDSTCSHSENRLFTFEIEYPRIILAELNTHRVLSKNSSSSRAIPFTKMVQQLNGVPVSFGANQAGMQAGKDHNAFVLGWPVEYDGNSGNPAWGPEEAWNEAKEHAIFFSKAFADAGYHKQVYNRLTEPFQMMKTVISGTEWNNFNWLRNHEAADPSLHELARCMQEAVTNSVTTYLKPGEWHLPYLDMSNNDTSLSPQGFYIADEAGPQFLTLADAIMVSCARCAAVSYRNEGYTLEKCRELYQRLVGADRKHASALEHAATPMRHENYTGVNNPRSYNSWEFGISHSDRNGKLWSGNYKGFIQHRKTIEGENHDA